MSQLVKKIISTSACPRPVGPYSQAVIVDRTLYLSGMVGIDPVSGKLVAGGIESEIRQTLTNIVKMLEKAGSKVDNVIKCTILLNDIVADYATVNDEYAKVFRVHHPVRTCYQAGNLPLGAAVEIEVIALVGDVRIEMARDEAKL